MSTTVVAAGGIVGLGESMFATIVILGGLGAMALAIFLSLKYSIKMGIGAGIGAFFGGVFLSILIYNIVGIRDYGVQEVRQKIGTSQSIYAP